MMWEVIIIIIIIMLGFIPLKYKLCATDTKVALLVQYLRHTSMLHHTILPLFM
jgi:hypothetical protein